MSHRSLTAPALCVLAVLSACSRQQAEPQGPRVAIDIAPLNLPSVQGVEYALAVFNAAPASPMFDVAGNVVGAGNLGQLVWQEESVTSNLFGNGAGGDVSYVGPCDASQPENWVALALRQVDVGANNGSYGGAAPFAGTDNVLDDENSAFTNAPGSNDGDPDFVNPCDFAAPCVMKFACEENQDTEVVFNLTIMRDAEQGFFDVAVNFEDVFCSMKIDSCYGEDDPIELLFDDEGNRVETAVIAAACSAGVGEGNTVMWMAPIVVTCDGGVSFTIDPTGDDDGDGSTPGVPGNHETEGSADGVVSDPGARTTGTLTFSIDPALVSPVTITIPVGTQVTRSDTGLDYRTTAVGTLDASTSSVSVAAQAVTEGSAYDGATTFVPRPLLGSDDVTYTVTIAGSGFTGGVNPVVTGAAGGLVGYALYWGDEQLDCGGAEVPESCNKVYWNVAINLDDLSDAGFTNCHVTTAITASSSPALDQFVNGNLPGPGQTYGFVQIDAQLTEGSEPICFEGPMGSEYASAQYGASADMIGSDPFPNLCSYFERGALGPRSLGDVEGYFQDTDSTPEDAAYAGSIPSDTAAPRLPLVFSDMGGDSTGLCRSRVLNTSAAVRFDGAGAMQEFAWRGTGGTGLYRIDIYTRPATGEWSVWGGYQLDLRTAEGRAFFMAGATFPNAGDPSVAIVLTRLDSPIPAAEDITIEVGPVAP